MKRTVLLIITLMLVLFSAGCTNEYASSEKSEYTVVCTAFPQYDWIKNITKDTESISVTLLCDSGTDMHSYQASAEDILKIKSCDLLVGTDGVSDKWAFDAAADNSHIKAVTLTDLAGVISLGEEDHAHGEECEEEHTHSTLSDEHIWTSPAKAVIIAEKLAQLMAAAFPDDASLKKSSESYIEELKALDEMYKQVCENAGTTKIVVADRFPFAHLAADYNLECFAAFPGCSADTDASFETIIYLASKLDEYSLLYVAVTENADLKTANAVISITEEKNQQILTLNSLQSVNAKQLEEGISYVSVMEENLKVLKKLLGYKGE